MKKNNVRNHKGKTSNSKDKQNAKKSISLPQPIQKIVDVVVQPLKTLSKRHHKKDEVDVPFAESRSLTELTTSMKFFYSNDEFIESVDDRHVYEQICKHYPALREDQKSLQFKRAAILQLLSNEEHMQSLKESYGMDPLKVVAFLFRICPSLFKGIFVKKVQNTIKNTDYAKRIKKHNYKIAKPKKAISKRKCRII